MTDNQYRSLVNAGYSVRCEPRPRIRVYKAWHVVAAFLVGCVLAYTVLLNQSLTREARDNREATWIQEDTTE
jgi:CHASE1-domain containing sensor protein